MKKKLFLLSIILTTFYANAQNVGINTTTPQETLDVNGSIRSRTINQNEGSNNDKVVVTDNKGTLKSIDRNELIAVIEDDTNTSIMVSGKGTADQPYKVNIRPASQIGQRLIWNGQRWITERSSILSNQEFSYLFLNEDSGNAFHCTSDYENFNFINNIGGLFQCREGKFVYEGFAIDKETEHVRHVHLALPEDFYILMNNGVLGNIDQSYGLSDNCVITYGLSDVDWEVCTPPYEIVYVITPYK